MPTPAAGSPAPGTLTVLTVAAFLAPGAWLVVTLPAQPVAQFLFLATAAAWLGVFAIRGRGHPVPSPVMLALGALLGASVIALMVNPYPVQQLVYDLYGEMPAMLWLAYPAVFLLAASVRLDAGMRNVLVPTVVAAGVLVMVMVVWRWTQGLVTTFGSPAYSIPAFAPIPFISLGIASVSHGKGKLYFTGAAAAIAAGLAYAGGGLSALFVLGMGGLLLCAVAPALAGVPERAVRPVRLAASALLAAAFIVVLAAQAPSLGASITGIDDVSGAEQSVATRIYLWDAAERMVAERPWFGYGPAGYRFSAVQYYDPKLFEFIAGAGSDPTAYSAPSPHSLLWESLTRLGVLGTLGFVALLVVWVRRVRSCAGGEGDVWPLRMGLAVGFAAYLISLLVTPVHFASGLLGAAVGGFAMAPSAGSGAGEGGAARRWSPGLRVLAVTVAAVFVTYGAWRMIGLTAGTIRGDDFQRDAERIAAAARIVPGEPLNERRMLEVALLSASDETQLESARAAVDAAPGYVLGYEPNLVQFASLGLIRAEALGSSDVSWERDLLERAARSLPSLPSLVAEQLHLAIVEGDLEALPGLIERARSLAATYPLTEEYVRRAEETLGR